VPGFCRFSNIEVGTTETRPMRIGGRFLPSRQQICVAAAVTRFAEVMRRIERDLDLQEARLGG